MINEFGVIDAVCSFLESNGYIIVKKKTSIPHSGDDIIAKKNNIRFYIDVYGETSTKVGTNNYGKPFSDSQQKVHVCEALYKCAEVFSRNKIPELVYKVGMAFAETEYCERYVSDIKGFLNENEIDVFLVDRDSNVKYLNNNIL